MSAKRALGASTLGAPDSTLTEVVAILRRHSATCVELRAAADAQLSVETGAVDRARIRRQFADAGIRIIAIGSSIRMGGPCDDGALSEVVAAHVRLAADIGADQVRVFPGIDVREGPTDTIPSTVRDRIMEEERLAARLLDAAARAASEGVSVSVETHDSNPRGADVRRLLEAAGGAAVEGLGVIWDVLHTWRTGEPPEETWSALGPWLSRGRGHVQVKDVASRTALTPVLQGTGAVPLADVIRVLDDGGYDGPLSLEWERRWYPDVEDLDRALAASADELRRLGAVSVGVSSP